MSHGAAPLVSPLEITDTHDETPLLCHLTLAASPEFQNAYTIPGQYVQISAGDNKPGFFAIASAPGEKQIDLLVKRGSPSADAITHKKRGDSLSISLPAGKGYPLNPARGGDVFLIGVGSGIAPLRALMLTILKERSAYKRVVLIYGARTSCAFPFSKEMESWAASDVEVERVCSQPAADSWNGRVGRVQDVLLSRKTPVDPASTVFVCGMKSMVEDVKSAFAGLGVPADRIHQNF
jgi:sulfhydrogenase subunit gamma (sulfur reductase)